MAVELEKLAQQFEASGNKDIAAGVSAWVTTARDRGLQTLAPETHSGPSYGEAYYEAAKERGIELVDSLTNRYDQYSLTPGQVNEVLASMEVYLRFGNRGIKPGNEFNAWIENRKELNRVDHFVTQVIASAQEHLQETYGVKIIPGNDARRDSLVQRNKDGNF